MQYLEENTIYMNIFTGSQASGKEWENDFLEREDKSTSWEEWAGDSLEEIQQA